MDIVEILNNCAMLYLGDNQVQNVYLGDDHIWPRAFVATLVPNYATVSVSAASSTTAMTWRLVVTQNGVETYNQPVTPTSYSITYPTGQTETNFSSYTLLSGDWYVNSRGSNGYISGTTAPSSYQMNPGTRSCTLAVQFNGTVTINGANTTVEASGSSVLTQANNAGHTANLEYSSISVTLGAYYSSGATACPASGGNTTIASVSGSKYQWYYWDAAGSSAKYYHQTYLNYYNDFNFSVSNGSDGSNSWAHIYSGTPYRITVDSRGTTEGLTERTIRIVATVKNTSISGYATLYQELNKVESTINAFDTVNSFTLNAIDKVPVTGGTVYLSGKWSGTHTAAEYIWTSTAHSGGGTSTVTNQACTPTSYKIDSGYELLYDSSAGVTFTNSNAHNTSDITLCTLTAYYGGKSSAKTVTQSKDTYTTETITVRTATISVASGSITAANGSLTLSYSAKHTPYTIQKWVSDGTEKSRTAGTTTNDTSRASITLTTSGPTGHASRFSRNGTTITHTSMTNKEGTDTVYATITHPDDSSITSSTSTYSATNSKSYGTVVITPSTSAAIPAYGGEISFDAYCPIIWTSTYSGDSLSTNNFTFSITTAANSGKRTYSGFDNSNPKKLTLTSLLKNEVAAKTSTIKATYKNDSSVYNTATFNEAKNEKYTSYGTPTTETKYAGWYFTVSSNAYSSQSGTWCHKSGGTATLTVTARHTEQYRDRTPYVYSWDSTVNNQPKEEGEIVGSYSTAVTVSDLNILNISTDSAWLSVGTLGSDGKATITIGNNTNPPGAARDSQITVTRPAIGGTSEGAQALTYKTVRIYQKAGNIALFVHDGNGNQVTQVSFAATGGSFTLYIDATGTQWKYTRPSWLNNCSISTATWTSSSTLSVGVTTTATYNRTGNLVFTAKEDSEVTVTIPCRQGPSIVPELET